MANINVEHKVYNLKTHYHETFITVNDGINEKVVILIEPFTLNTLISALKTLTMMLDDDE